MVSPPPSGGQASEPGPHGNGYPFSMTSEKVLPSSGPKSNSLMRSSTTRGTPSASAAGSAIFMRHLSSGLVTMRSGFQATSPATARRDCRSPTSVMPSSSCPKK